MTYVLPGTWLQADMRSGLVERRRFSTDTAGVAVETLPASAIEECGDALMGWWQDLARFTCGPKPLRLSGGRDSREVAAYALASGLEVEISTFSPPSLDADLAAQLVGLAERNVPFVRGDVRKMIKGVYEEKTSFLEHAVSVLRSNNPDVCVSTFLDCISTSKSFQPIMHFSTGGHQGEIRHPYYYSAEMVEAEHQ